MNSNPKLDLPDQQLLEAARAGDCRAMAELVDRSLPKLYEMASLMIHDLGDVEEAVQAAIASALHGLKHVASMTDLSSLLSRTTIQHALQLVKARPWRNDSPGFEGSVDALLLRISIRWLEDLEVLHNKEQLRELLVLELWELPTEWRYIFVLRDIEGFSPAQTAHFLDTTEKVVQYQLSCARLQLAARLSRYRSVRQQWSTAAAAQPAICGSSYGGNDDVKGNLANRRDAYLEATRRDQWALGGGAGDMLESN